MKLTSEFNLALFTPNIVTYFLFMPSPLDIGMYYVDVDITMKPARRNTG